MTDGYEDASKQHREGGAEENISGSPLSFSNSLCCLGLYPRLHRAEDNIGLGGRL